LNKEENLKIDMALVSTGLYVEKRINNGNFYQFIKKIVVG